MYRQIHACVYKYSYELREAYEVDTVLSY